MSQWHGLIVGAMVVGSCFGSSVAEAQEGCPGSQQSFEYTGATQTYVVPSGVSELTITAIGGGGGTSAASSSSSGDPMSGGGGALIVAAVPVTPGEILTILVGGQGQPATGRLAGGGGGSFVYRSPTVDGLLVAAGGGAAGGSWYPGQLDGSTTETAYDGTGTDPGLAGTGGSGGGGSTSGFGGAGGAGLLGDGGDGDDGSTGGTSIASGGAGGISMIGGDGGFGEAAAQVATPAEAVPVALMAVALEEPAATAEAVDPTSTPPAL
jgi:hypothetical protein